MALAQLNGVDVLEGSVCMPLKGAWHADLAIDASNSGGLAGVVGLVLGGTLQLVGVCTPGGVGAAFGQVLMRVVGGYGGLSLTLPPKAYSNTTLALPLKEALTTAGEQLDPATDQGALSTPLARWNRGNEQVSAVLDGLLEEFPGGTWRVLPGGNTWMGKDTWPAWTGTYQTMKYDAHLGRLELGVDIPSLLPGESLLGRHAVYVEHQIRATSTRTLAVLQ